MLFLSLQFIIPKHCYWVSFLIVSIVARVLRLVPSCNMYCSLTSLIGQHTST